MPDNSMDKLYFVATDTTTTKPVRAFLSQLSNVALDVREHPNNIDSRHALLESLQALKTVEHYQSCKTDDDFVREIDRDLFSACEYWEEEWRYKAAIPLIKLAISNPEFLNLDNLPELPDKARIYYLLNHAIAVKQEPEDKVLREALLGEIESIKRSEYFREIDISQNFYKELKEQLLAICSYRDEEQRYIQAYPIIKLAILNTEFLTMDIPTEEPNPIDSPIDKETQPCEQLKAQSSSDDKKSKAESILYIVIIIGILLGILLL